MTFCHNWQHIALASAYTVVYARWCHTAYRKFCARFEHCFWPSHLVKPLSRSAQLWKLLVRYHPWPESLRVLFVGRLEGGVRIKTIHWIGDDRNACWVYRGAEEDLCRHVITNMSSASRGNSKEWWAHQAHTDKKKLYTDAVQYVWSF